jgi:hypothetical protein
MKEERNMKTAKGLNVIDERILIDRQRCGQLKEEQKKGGNPEKELSVEWKQEKERERERERERDRKS